MEYHGLREGSLIDHGGDLLMLGRTARYSLSQNRPESPSVA